MCGQIKITTGFPSAANAARNLGVSKRVARDLSLLAERSLRTGEFVLPGVGRLVRGRGVHVRRDTATGDTIKVSTKNGAKFRVAKTAKDAIAPPKK